MLRETKGPRLHLHGFVTYLFVIELRMFQNSNFGFFRTTEFSITVLETVIGPQSSFLKIIYHKAMIVSPSNPEKKFKVSFVRDSADSKR
jgi:hypothetical protein